MTNDNKISKRFKIGAGLILGMTGLSIASMIYVANSNGNKKPYNNQSMTPVYVAEENNVRYEDVPEVKPELEETLEEIIEPKIEEELTAKAENTFQSPMVELEIKVEPKIEETFGLDYVILLRDKVHSLKILTERDFYKAKQNENNLAELYLDRNDKKPSQTFYVRDLSERVRKLKEEMKSSEDKK